MFFFLQGEYNDYEPVMNQDRISCFSCLVFEAKN